MIEPILRQSFTDAADCLTAFRADTAAQRTLAELVERITVCFEAGGKILTAGNGGSMTDAMHFAEEWTGRFRADRRPFPALALSDPSHMTCVANDFGFEHVFSRMVEAFGRPEDLLILLSTSGNSPNLLAAAHAGREIGMHVVGFLGRDGGRLKPLCDTAVIAPGVTSDRIQEIHMLSLHILIEAAEVRLGVAG